MGAEGAWGVLVAAVCLFRELLFDVACRRALSSPCPARSPAGEAVATVIKTTDEVSVQYHRDGSRNVVHKELDARAHEIFVLVDAWQLCVK